MSDTSPVVAVIDVDGVLYDYVHHLGNAAAVHLGRPRSEFPPARVWNFYKDQWGLTTPEFLELVDVAVSNHGFLRTGRPYRDALDGFARLHELDVRIHIATHIGTEGDPNGHQAARREWLDEQGFVFADLTFTGDKASVARSYLDQGWRVFALEDNVDNFRSLRDAGASAYLVDQLWNLPEVGAPRVTSVKQFAEVIEAQL